MAGPTSIIPPIPITAEDKFSKVFDQLRKITTGTFKDVTGSVREASDAGKKLSEAFEPFAKLAGAGGILGGGLAFAGAFEGLERFARSGAEIGRTSARIGVGTDALQRIGQAAYLAGGNATAGAQGLETLGEKLHGAAWGRDQEAIAVFKEFGIAVRDSNLQVRKADEVLPEVADKIKSLKDPYQQSMLATALFGSAARELLPIMRGGSERIAELMKEVDKHNSVVGNSGVKATTAFEEAQRNLNLSVAGVGNALAEHYIPKLTPAIKKTTEWLDEVNKSPAALKALETGGEIAAAAIGVTLLTSITKLTAAMVKMNLAFAGSILGSGALRFLGPIGAFLGAMWPGTAGSAGENRLPGADKRLTDLAAGLSPEQAAALLNDPAQVQGILNNLGAGAYADQFRGMLAKRWRGEAITSGGGQSGGGDPRGVEGAIRASAIKYGHDPDIAMRVARSEGLGNFTGDSGTSFGAFQLHTGGGLGDRFQRETGLDPRDKSNELAMIDWSMKNLSETGWGPYHGAARFAGVGAREGIGVGSGIGFPHGPFPPGTHFTQSGINKGRAYSDSLLNMPPDQAANVAASMAAIRKAQAGGQDPYATGPRFLPDVPDYSGALDSNHHVSIDINGLPQGGRARLLDAAGPAKLTLRVQHALDSP